MKNRKNIEKIGIAALALLCVFLVFKLVSEITGNPAGAVQPITVSAQTPNSTPQTDPARKSVASPKSASQMQVRALDEYRPKPLPGLGRNPFNFGQAPLSPAQRAVQAARAAGGGAMTASTAGPPPIPLRAIGYSERGGAGPEAYLMDNNDVYVVHDGDLLSNRFRILKITSTNVEVQDGASGEKAQLPIPVVQ
ncbi:MAG TPA: hypothetical protein VFZ27_17890 [Terriglobia bacterium]|nr:hypothetical protein [Terriglobia bacterium]